MRILILGHYEIASNYAIGMLVQHLVQNTRLDLKLALSGHGDAKLENKDQSAEQSDFVRLAQYERLLCTELDAGIDRLGLNVMGFKQIEHIINKPIEIIAKPNHADGLVKLGEWAPDLIISIRYRKILHEQAIAIPPMGVINLHSGLLPEYRGAMATFWSMLNKENNYGSTLHFITDRGIDTGAIIDRSSHKLDLSENYLSNVLSLYPAGVSMIVDCVNKIVKNRRIDVQTPNNQGKYYSFPSILELEKFNNLGLKLF